MTRRWRKPGEIRLLVACGLLCCGILAWPAWVYCLPCHGLHPLPAAVAFGGLHSLPLAIGGWCALTAWTLVRKGAGYGTSTQR